MTIRRAVPDDVDAMARLHAAEITEGFLPTLGPRFLARLYRRAVFDSSSFAFVAGCDGVVVGFAAATEDLRGLYRSFLVRDGLPAAAAAAPNLVRSWRRVLETLRYGGGGEAALPPAEVIAVAVDRRARGQGVGRRLVAAVIDEFASRGVPAARVVAGTDNEAALRLYHSAGFRHAATVQVHAGVASEVLTWS
jgi:ribosomal protein S18 acetylase RimI-like enzyme